MMLSKCVCFTKLLNFVEFVIASLDVILKRVSVCIK